MKTAVIAVAIFRIPVLFGQRLPRYAGLVGSGFPLQGGYMKFTKLLFGLVFTAVLGIGSQAVAVDAEDTLILGSIRNVTAGIGGTLVVVSDAVTLRERRGVDYNLGKLSIHIAAGVPTACLQIALAAAPGHRFVVRVRENAFTSVRPSITDKLLVAAADMKSCSWAD